MIECYTVFNSEEWPLGYSAIEEFIDYDIDGELHGFYLIMKL